MSRLRRTGIINTVSDDWFGPGIGPIRSTVSTTVDNDSPTGYSQSTVGYALAGRRSETVVPVATAVGSDASRGALGAFELSFSEDMDVDTLAQALLVVNGSNGVIAGTTTVSRRSLRFVPSLAWQAGTYTARLAPTATDRLGNGVGGTRAWTFKADTTAPALNQSNPTQGALDVDVGQNLLLTFSESVAPSTVNVNTVPVTYIGGAIAAT